MKTKLGEFIRDYDLLPGATLQRFNVPASTERRWVARGWIRIAGYSILTIKGYREAT